MLEIKIGERVSGYVCVGKCIFSGSVHYYPFSGRLWHGVSGRDYGYDIFGNKNECGCKMFYSFYWDGNAVIFSSEEEAHKKVSLWRDVCANSISNMDKTCEYRVMSVEEYIKFAFETDGYLPTRSIDVAKYVRFV